MTTTHPSETSTDTARVDLDFLWLELTGRCPLSCRHCYAGSGPTGNHGSMSTKDWQDIIDQAVALGTGTVQFIGGEPTQHPAFADLLAYVLDAGIQAEIYSNLVTVRESWWGLFAQPRVSLATSYYSDDPSEHDHITGRAGSHQRTRKNIAEAVVRGVPLRVAVIDILPGQRVQQAKEDVARLGVTRVGSDRVRELGRGLLPDPAQLCGHCGHGRAAISPEGQVWPCVMARWLPLGNVLNEPLEHVVDPQRMRELTASIPGPGMVCAPDKTGCKPTKGDGQDCQPAEKPACKPKH